VAVPPLEFAVGIPGAISAPPNIGERSTYYTYTRRRGRRNPSLTSSNFSIRLFPTHFIYVHSLVLTRCQAGLSNTENKEYDEAEN